MAENLSSRTAPQIESSVSHEELRQLREEIARGLRRSHQTTGVILLVIVALSIVAVSQGVRSERSALEAESATRDAEARLRESLLVQARELRSSGEVNCRQRSLKILREAAAIRPDLELKNEAIAALATTEVREGVRFSRLPDYNEATAFSQDHQWAAVADKDTVELFRLGDEQKVHTFPCGKRRVAWLGFSPSNTFLAARLVSGEAVIWRLEPPGQWLCVPEGEPVSERHKAQTLAFSGDSRFIAAPAAHAMLYVYDLENRSCWRAMPTFPEIQHAAFYPKDVRLAVIGGSRCDAIILGAEKTEPLLRLPEWIKFWSVTWHPEKPRIFLGRSDGRVMIHDRATHQTETLPHHLYWVETLATDTEGEALLTAAKDDVTRLQSLATPEVWLQTERGKAVAFRPRDRQIIYHDFSKGYATWQFSPSKVFASFTTPNAEIEKLATEPSGRLAWLAQWNGVYVWEAVTGEVRPALKESGYIGVGYYPSNQTLVTMRRNQLSLWPTSNGVPTTAKPGHTIPLTEESSCRFDLSATGLLLASSRTETLVLDLSKSPSMIRRLPVGNFLEIRIIPAHDAFAAIDRSSGRVRVFHLHTGSLLREFIRRDWRGQIAVSPGGDLLAISDRTRYEIYRTKDWSLAHTIQPTPGKPASGAVTFSPDGLWLAAGTSLDRVQVLACRDWSELFTLDAPTPDEVSRLAFLPENRGLAAGTSRGVFQMWNLDKLDGELRDLGFAGLEETMTPSAASSIERTAVGPHRPRWSAGLAGSGIAAAMIAGLLNLRYHRRLSARYTKVEELVQRRERVIDQARQEGIQGQKMQAIGLLAGGVSHEFKNLLSVISLSNDLIRRELGPESNVHEEVGNIDHAVEQGRAVVNSLLGYSRPRDAEEQSCAPVQVVQSTLKLLNREFLGNVKVAFQPPDLPPRLRISPARLEQALINLCMNAVEAMRREGELRIELRPGVAVEDGATWSLRPPATGQVMTVAMSDTGCGIERAVLERIFEPFFTTKANAETPVMTVEPSLNTRRSGSGLGLTTVYRLAEKANAGLAVWSRVGKGSIFYLVLPVETDDLGATRPVGEPGAG